MEMKKEQAAFGFKFNFNFNAKKKHKLQLLLIALPMFAFVVLFCYVPLFGWSYAFVDYKLGIPVFKQPFVGFKYFKMIFQGLGYFPVVMRNTLVLSSFNLLCSPVPIIFAIMLSQMRSKGSRVIQTVTSLPNFISWVLVYAIFFAFFSSEDGVINKILLHLNLIKEPANVLGNVDVAWYLQVLIAIWKNTGWNAIIYIAAMAGIDQELYAAAEVDGAGRFQKIWHVTMPGIIPTYFVLLLLAIANMLNNGFEQYYVFRNSLVLDKLEVLDTYIYRLGIGEMQYAFSTAMGIFKSSISIILLTLANTLSKFVRGESIF